jgi:hypothetical protein
MKRIFGAKELLIKAKTQAKKQAKRLVKRQAKRQAKRLIGGIPTLESSKEK